MSRFYNQYRDLFIDQFPPPRNSNEMNLQKSPNQMIKSSKLMMQPYAQRSDNTIAPQEYYGNQIEYSQTPQYITPNIQRPAYSGQNEKGERLKNVYSMIVNNPIENFQKYNQNQLNQYKGNQLEQYSINSPLLSLNKMRDNQKQNVNNFLNKSKEEKSSNIPNYYPVNYKLPFNYQKESRTNPPYAINSSENINPVQMENYNRNGFIPTNAQNLHLNRNVGSNYDNEIYTTKNVYQEQIGNPLNKQIIMNYNQANSKRVDAESMNPNDELTENLYNQNSYQIAISRRMEYKSKLIVI